MSEAPARKCWQSVWVMLAVLLAALVIFKWHQNLPLLNPAKAGRVPFLYAIDSESYLAIATNGPSQTPSPFSKRLLYPWLAGALSRLTGEPVSATFAALNLIALLALSFCLAEILRETTGQPLIALLFLLTPFPLESFELGYLPDLTHTALTTAFFLLMLRERWVPAALVLFVSFLTRESTLVLCLVTVALAWIRGRKRFSSAVGGVLLAGCAATAYFGRLGKPNLHHLPDFLYLLGKVPYYFLLSFFGLRVWSDVRPNEGTPFVTWRLPHWLKIGADQTIGLVQPDWRYPISTFLVWLTVFGVGPLIIFYLRRRIGKTRELPLAIELALTYGGLSYLIGPMLGDWVDRLVGFGWPLFWIAMPWLLYRSSPALPPWHLKALAVCYSLACWWPRFFGYGNDRNANPWPCFGVLICYFIADAILRRAQTSPVATETQVASRQA